MGLTQSGSSFSATPHRCNSREEFGEIWIPAPTYNQLRCHTMDPTSANFGAASRIVTLCPTKAILIAAASPPNPAPTCQLPARTQKHTNDQHMDLMFMWGRQLWFCHLG